MHFRLHPWWHWWAVHLRWWAGDARLLLRRTVHEFSDDHCPQLSASISYYVFFSIFPLAILFVSVSGLILTNDSLRGGVVDDLFELLPLSEGEGRADLENAVEGVATGFSAIGLVSIFGLLWTASGMMGSLRYALNQAWDTEFRRPFLRGKLVDLLMVLGAGTLFTLSIGATIFLQVARRVSDDLSGALGPLGVGAAGGFEGFAIVTPFLISFATFMFVYKLIPDVRTRFRHVWLGALLAALLFELIKNGFALYLRYFGNYDAVYGSLGAVIAFLFFIYLSSIILLLGAEVASEWPRVLHGHYDETLTRTKAGQGAPLRRRLSATLGRLVHHEAEIPLHISDPSRGQQRQQRKADEVARRLREQEPGAGESPAAEPPDEASDEAPDEPPDEPPDEAGGGAAPP